MAEEKSVACRRCASALGQRTTPSKGSDRPISCPHEPAKV